MRTNKLKPLGRCRKLREQRSASELGRQRARFVETELMVEEASFALEDNRRNRRQRERQIYQAIRKNPVPVDQLETLRWELAAMELEIERLAHALEDARAALDVAAADVERAREVYLHQANAARKWDKVVARAANSEKTLLNRFAEIEQDDANIDYITRQT